MTSPAPQRRDLARRAVIGVTVAMLAALVARHLSALGLASAATSGLFADLYGVAAGELPGREHCLMAAREAASHIRRADLGIAFAYALIPGAIGGVAYATWPLTPPARRLGISLIAGHTALFVWLCGLTHELGALSFYEGDAYLVLAPVATITALVSILYVPHITLWAWRLAVAAVVANEASDLAASAEGREITRAGQLERLADLGNLCYWEVQSPALDEEERWLVTCSVGGGLSRFGIIPHEVEGRDVRPWLDEHERALYEKIFDGVLDHAEYEKESMTVAGPESWSTSLHQILDADIDEDGRVIGISAVSYPVPEAVKNNIRTDMWQKSIQAAMSGFAS